MKTHILSEISTWAVNRECLVEIYWNQRTRKYHCSKLRIPKMCNTWRFNFKRSISLTTPFSKLGFLNYKTGYFLPYASVSIHPLLPSLILHGTFEEGLRFTEFSLSALKHLQVTSLYFAIHFKLFLYCCLFSHFFCLREREEGMQLWYCLDFCQEGSFSPVHCCLLLAPSAFRHGVKNEVHTLPRPIAWCESCLSHLPSVWL